MTTLDSMRVSFERWLRQGQDPVATRLRHVGTSAVGTYAAYVAYGLAHPALRRPLAGAEASAPMPGDALVAAPDSDKTFAVDIAAPPARVWPLLVQLGWGRAGWYSWYPLDNGGVPSPPGVVPDLQRLAQGDAIPDGPRAAEGLGLWRVVELRAPATLVLYSRRVPTTGREVPVGDTSREPIIDCSWAFVVSETPAGSRLRVRVRAKVIGGDAGRLGELVRRFFDVGDTVMEWTMLDGIKARAEAALA